MSARKRLVEHIFLRSHSVSSDSKSPLSSALARSSSSAPSIADLWNVALDEYRRSIDVDLVITIIFSYSKQLERCNVKDYAHILDILQEASDRTSDSRQGAKASRVLRKALKPVVRGLGVILEASAETASSVGAPGGKGIFVAIAVLLQAANRVSESYENLERLLEHLSTYVERMKLRLQVPIRQETERIATQALVEVLRALELARGDQRRTKGADASVSIAFSI